MNSRIKTQEQDKFIIRFPEGMRDEIKAAAERNGRSMNSEIIERLSAPVERKTLRDEIAMAALTGICSNDYSLNSIIPSQCADWAYQFADEMLIVRRRGTKATVFTESTGQPQNAFVTTGGAA